jgi:hypothetical protein
MWTPSLTALAWFCSVYVLFWLWAAWFSVRSRAGRSLPPSPRPWARRLADSQVSCKALPSSEPIPDLPPVPVLP